MAGIVNPVSFAAMVAPTGSEDGRDVTITAVRGARPVASTELGPRPGDNRPERWRTGPGAVLAGTWISLTWLLDLPPVGYVLLGVPLIVFVQLLVRRRSPIELWLSSRACAPIRSRHRLIRVALVAAVGGSLLLRGLLVAQAWPDTALTLGIGAVILGVGVPLIGRPFVILVLTAALLAAAMFALAPRLAADRTGDPELLSELAGVVGYHNLGVAVVDLNARQPVRLAGFGSTETTRFEAGSITKAMTGLVVADAVARGELRLDDPVSAYLPLTGAPVGSVTIRELVTHTSGLPRDSSAVVRGAIWRQPLGLNPLNRGLDQLLDDARMSPLTTRGTVSYSNVGAALAGQAVAVAARMPYADLMHNRLFQPLGMTDTAIQTSRLVARGHAPSGRPVEPWILSGYAPAGGAVTTARDLSRLATALLDGSAPGIKALDALTPLIAAQPGRDGKQTAMFWQLNYWADGRVVTWHDGMSAGYGALIYLDRPHQRASIVLSDVAVSASDLGNRLLVAG